MNLKDFEEHINPDIVERGYDYYENGLVSDLENTEPGLWIAYVFGSERYTVTVNTHRSIIKDWECDCPYDWGPVCKHVVAVFYAIAEEIGTEPIPGSDKGKKKKSQKEQLKEIYKKVDKQDLIKFLDSQFRNSMEMKHTFLAYFAEMLDEDFLTKYAKMIRNFSKSAQGRHGFIDYQHSFTFMKPVLGLVDKAEELTTRKEYSESIAICRAVIEEVTDAIHQMDDSSGEAGFAINRAFEIFAEVLSQNLSPLFMDELFDYCIKEYQKSKYHDFSFEWHFLDLLVLLTNSTEKEKALFKLIDKEIGKNRNEEYGDWVLIDLQKTKVKYLQNQNRHKEAQQIIISNIEYPEFRTMLVDETLQDENFEEAKRLTREGRDIARKIGHTGTEFEWFEKLFQIAETEKNEKDIIALAEKLYFNYRSDAMKYYKKLKKHYHSGQWQEKAEEIINKIKGSDELGSVRDAHQLADIFVEEKYINRLLKLLKLNSFDFNFIYTYAKNISSVYPGELPGIFREGLLKMAEKPGRSGYRQLASNMKKAVKFEGCREMVYSLINELKIKYKNRPAMIEILDRNFP